MRKRKSMVKVTKLHFGTPDEIQEVAEKMKQERLNKLFHKPQSVRPVKKR